jgi:hypothetical protein
MHAKIVKARKKNSTKMMVIERQKEKLGLNIPVYSSFYHTRHCDDL